MGERGREREREKARERKRARERDVEGGRGRGREDRKSTRLNYSHGYISDAVFCLKKKNRDGSWNRRLYEENTIDAKA